MSFQQALSGLSVANASLNAIGNNIANGSTVGFKAANAQFADIFATSMQGGGTSSIGIGAQVDGISQQFVQGNLTTTNNPLDIAINGGGFFRLDDNGSISYSRNGQFLLDKEGFIVNNGGLKLTGYAADPITGDIVPGNILPLQVSNTAIPPAATTLSQIQVNLDSRANPPASMTRGSMTGSATVSNVTITAGTNDTLDLTIDGESITGVIIPAGTYTSGGALAQAVEKAINEALKNEGLSTLGVSATVDQDKLVIRSNSVGSKGALGQGSSVEIDGGNAETTLIGTATSIAGEDRFDNGSTVSYTASTAQTVFDSLGNPHTMSVYYVKTSQPGTWQMYTALDGNLLMDAGDPLATPPIPDTPNVIELVFSDSGVLMTPAPGEKIARIFDVTTGARPLVFELDLGGTSQYGIPFGTNQLVQDGYTSGKLSGMSVSADGVVQGRYSNGQSRNMGQLVLANFNNPNGLQSMGNNTWTETIESGSPIPGAPGSGNLGLVKSGALEDSNVDMTAELVAMITAQRAYQANAQSIKTQDQIMQTLVNLR